MDQRNAVLMPAATPGDTPMARRLAILAISGCFLTYFVAVVRGNTSLVEIGSYNLCAEDIATIPLAAAILSRIDVGRISLTRILLAIALALAFMNLLAGVSGGRSFAALFEFRSRVIFLLFFLFILARWGTLRPGEYLRLALVAAAFAFILLYLLRVVGGPLVLVDPESFGAQHFEYLEGRLINAETVIFLGAAAAFFLSEGSRPATGNARRWGYWALAVVCIVVTLLSRQRTGTAAVIAGLCTLFLLHPTLLGQKRSLRLLAGITLFGAVLIAALAAAGDLFDVLPESFRESLMRRDTLYGRLEIWSSSLAAFSARSFAQRAFGRPSGEPATLYLEQGEWDFSVHNAYIGLLLDYGFVGAALWGTLLIASLVAAVRASHRGRVPATDLEPSVAASWIVILLIYGFSYEWRNAAGVFLGFAMMPLIRRSEYRMWFRQSARMPMSRLGMRAQRRV